VGTGREEFGGVRERFARALVGEGCDGGWWGVFDWTYGEGVEAAAVGMGGVRLEGFVRGDPLGLLLVAGVCA
jgi:hypothetical protein